MRMTALLSQQVRARQFLQFTFISPQQELLRCRGQHELRVLDESTVTVALDGSQGPLGAVLPSLLQILLMIVLGGPPLRRLDDLRHDLPLELRLLLLHGLVRGFALLIIVNEDRGSVLRAVIPKLPIEGGGIMDIKEEAVQLVGVGLRRIKRDADRFGMARVTRQDALVVNASRLHMAARVTDLRLHDTRQTLKEEFDAPKAARGDRDDAVGWGKQVVAAGC
mmetsp:Transcript_10800/g.29815  ORF Transcript_10800/g.29815 Transcript_10800/m.29815 type:complete len:222 (-) Transcript_10800:148-813(-)